MQPVLDYSRKAAAEESALGGGYIFLMFVNVAALIAAVLVLFVGVSGDSYAHLAAIFIGGPVAIAHLGFGGIPSWIYLGTKGPWMMRNPKFALLIFSVAPVLLNTAGIVLSFVLPTTHGSTC
jgi:hypothetical protein